MPVSVPPRHPIAHLPFGLGGLRRLEVAPMLDGLLPPPRRMGSRGGAALGRALLDGLHTLSQVGRRLAEHGRVALGPPGLPRAALPDDRWGPSLEALGAAHLPPGLRAVALKTRAVSALPTPGRPQDPTTRAG